MITQRNESSNFRCTFNDQIIIVCLNVHNAQLKYTKHVFVYREYFSVSYQFISRAYFSTFLFSSSAMEKHLNFVVALKWHAYYSHRNCYFHFLLLTFVVRTMKEGKRARNCFQSVSANNQQCMQCTLST